MTNVLITYPMTFRGDRDTDGDFGVRIYNDDTYGDFVTVFCVEDSDSFADVLGAEKRTVANAGELRAFLDSMPESAHYLCVDPRQDRSAAVFVCVAELYDDLSDCSPA